MSGPTLLQVIRADIEATTHPNFRLYSTARFWGRALAKLVVSPNVRVVVTYRLGHALTRRGLMPLAMLLRARGVKKAGAELNPQATIGPGLYLAHSVGVVIGAFVEIGANCTIYHGATVGALPGKTAGSGSDYDIAHIGDNVTVGTNAVIFNGVTVGDGAVIGANTVISKDVGAYEVVVGSPARVVAVRAPEAT